MHCEAGAPCTRNSGPPTQKMLLLRVQAQPALEQRQAQPALAHPPALPTLEHLQAQPKAQHWEAQPKYLVERLSSLQLLLRRIPH